MRPHPGPQAPRHPGPPPHPHRSRPQRSCQQRRPHPHCTSVILSMAAVAAAESGRIGAAWVVPEPPAKTRPAIPTANSVRNICVHPIFPWLIRSSSRSLERREATDQLKNGTSCSMDGNRARALKRETSAFGPSRPKPNLHTASALRSRADLDAGRANRG